MADELIRAGEYGLIVTELRKIAAQQKQLIELIQARAPLSTPSPAPESSPSAKEDEPPLPFVIHADDEER